MVHSLNDVLRPHPPDVVAIPSDAFFEQKMIPTDAHQDTGFSQIVDSFAGYSEPTGEHRRGREGLVRTSQRLSVFALTRHSKDRSISVGRAVTPAAGSPEHSGSDSETKAPRAKAARGALDRCLG